MFVWKRRCLPLLLLLWPGLQLAAQEASLTGQVRDAMYRATRFMRDSVSTDGGYVWYYLPDRSRRWGEMEAYPSMIWMQDGTVSVAHMLLDAYEATGDDYYYTVAAAAADAMIRGQSPYGGWNYMIDFAGEASMRKWYATIGKNGWRLEEFQHYYGNDTFDDDVSSDATRFLLRIYLAKKDPRFKPALDKAIAFILESQYPNGGWPQRYPLRHDFQKAGHPDYSSFYTFNDDVIWENVLLLIQCYAALGDARFLKPIQRGMDFYLLSQTAGGGWAQQYDSLMQPAGARTYEPKALLPSTTYGNARLLMRFYRYTGDRKYLKGVPAAIRWLKENRLPEALTEGRYTHPTFVDPVNHRPMFVHRKGSNVKYGFYYVDQDDQHLLAHYGGKTRLDVESLQREYRELSALSPGQVTRDSPLKKRPDGQGRLPAGFAISRAAGRRTAFNATDAVRRVIEALDEQGRWLVKHARISHPYSGDGRLKTPTLDYASTNVGDQTDTSPFRDSTDQDYISVPDYIRNMQVLIRYIRSVHQNPAP